MTTVTIRTYESFSIRWDRGSTWSGYATEAEAQAVVDFAAARDGQATGAVIAEPFEVRWFAGDASIVHARPGIAERFEEIDESTTEPAPVTGRYHGSVDAFDAMTALGYTIDHKVTDTYARSVTDHWTAVLVYDPRPGLRPYYWRTLRSADGKAVR